MRIVLHIGPEQAGAERLQHVLDTRRARLGELGVLVPRAAGARNHTRLFMAATDPDHIDPLRYNRGYGRAGAQAALRQTLTDDIAREIDGFKPQCLILTASQLAPSLHRVGELERLRHMLLPFSSDIRIVAHADEPARLLARYYGHQILQGRARGLEGELELAQRDDWWNAALAGMPAISPEAGLFEEIQGLPFWLDFARLVDHWESVFGTGAVSLRGYDAARFHGPGILDEIAAIAGVQAPLGQADASVPPPLPSAAWLARARAMNGLCLQLLQRGQHALPRKVWRGLLMDIAYPGPPIDAGALAPVSARFASANAALAKRFPDLGSGFVSAPDPRPDWREADPENGYRATQYLLAFMHRIDAATREVRERAQNAPLDPEPAPVSPILPKAARETLDRLRQSPFAPHNRLGRVADDAPAPPFARYDRAALPKGSRGNVIVGCMKNEAPYIVEWVAYHRAIGVDDFLIYTNGCDDGTDAILERLQSMGVLQHRNNDNWKGKSPQQHALNCALKEPLIRKADWIIHIDVDEFINIRCGNGTLPDLFAHIPKATNVAMTWRLFGHNGVHRLEDRFVIDQFDRAAPKFCPKPHTVWGFKTMFRNIGAYEKISCHRPNKLSKAFRNKVKWVNGSGQDMTGEVAENGWRNSKASIGYDLVQLNHYALRSAESYLIKRQRGRALHVDRSIGLNYWIRMDWSDHRDLTIKRNLPRLQAEYDRLLQDPTLRALHDAGLDWHRAKARELHTMPEFEDLYQKALRMHLSAPERAAYALTLDMES